MTLFATRSLFLSFAFASATVLAGTTALYAQVVPTAASLVDPTATSDQLLAKFRSEYPAIAAKFAEAYRHVRIGATFLSKGPDNAIPQDIKLDVVLERA